MITGIEKAIKNLGSQTELGRRVGVSQQAVNIWLLQGYVPVGRAGLISRISKVPLKELVNPKYLAIIDSDEV